MKLFEADLRHENEKQLRFETLLADISTQFINLPSERIDSEIEVAQRRICRCLALDLSALWQWSKEFPRILTVTHLYTMPGGPSRPEGIDAQKAFPWVLNKMLQGKALVLSSDDMPPEALIDQESRRHFGVKSSVVLPLSVGGGPLLGVLTFDTLREERLFPAETVQRLKLTAQIFCNALVRKESDRVLRKSEERLSLAADSAGAGIWELNCTTNLFWATEKARAIFGYGSEEIIGMERFEQSVYSGDLERIRQVINQSLDTKEPLSVEYRIHTDNGEIKWIYSSGHPYFKSDGEPDRILGVSLDITERKLIEEKLRESEATFHNNQKDLQRLAGGLISVKEEELRRLSRELHDDLTQRLAVLSIEAGKMEQHLNKMAHAPSELQKISLIKEQLIRVSEDVHRISRQLHPTILDDLGLVRAIESECAALHLRENLEIIFRKEDVPDRIPNDVSLCLYRIIQEGLKNIISHSGAERCEVYLKAADETLCLTVKDEGRGFDPVEVRSKPGLGLSSMRERAQLVMGVFSIDTQLEQGTAIHVSIPLKKGGV